MTYTKAPWKVIEYSNSFDILADDDNGEPVIAERITTKANAQLIATSPDLLKAAQELINTVHPIADERYTPLLQAIARATMYE